LANGSATHEKAVRLTSDEHLGIFQLYNWGEKMRSLNKKKILTALASLASIAFASWVLVSARDLNASTLRSIDEPLNGTQAAALQLSTMLTATSAAIFTGSLFAAIMAVQPRSACSCPLQHREDKRN
jgi:hypothetical protein